METGEESVLVLFTLQITLYRKEVTDLTLQNYFLPVLEDNSPCVKRRQMTSIKTLVPRITLHEKAEEQFATELNLQKGRQKSGHMFLVRAKDGVS